MLVVDKLWLLGARLSIIFSIITFIFMIILIIVMPKTVKQVFERKILRK